MDKIQYLAIVTKTITTQALEKLEDSLPSHCFNKYFLVDSRRNTFHIFYYCTSRFHVYIRDHSIFTHTNISWYQMSWWSFSFWLFKQVNMKFRIMSLLNNLIILSLTNLSNQNTSMHAQILILYIIVQHGQVIQMLEF